MVRARDAPGHYRQARVRGCDTITGVDMFVRQAARQIELFTGLTPDMDAMRVIMRKALSPLTKALVEGEEEAKPAENDGGDDAD